MSKGLSPQQHIILDQLRHTRGSPIPVSRLITAVWGSRYDGGPDDPARCIRVLIHGIRAFLAFRGVHILTIGSGRGSQGWMIDPGHLDRLEAVLAEMEADDLATARARYS